MKLLKQHPFFVGVAGFEPATSCSQSRRDDLMIPVYKRLDTFNLKNVSIMSQITPISYPKVRIRKDGKVEVVVYCQNQRIRLQNGSKFGIKLRPNSFPLDQRLNQANILAAQIYSKLLLGFTPLRKGQQENTINKSDLYYLRKALNQKLEEGHSRHHQNALKLAFNRIKENTINNEVNKEVINCALSNYINNISFNTLRRNMNVLCSLAVKLGMKNNPTESIKRKREVAKLNKPIKNIHALLDELKLFNENLYLCCLFTYGCLLRPHREVRELRWCDFTDDLSYIRLSGERNKSGRNRIVPVPNYIRLALTKKEGHLNIFTGKREPFDKDYFKGVWSRFKKTSKTLRDNQTLYSFRHTGAIDVYKRTGSIEKLKTAMGHSNIIVSLTYLRGLDVTDLKEDDMPKL